MATGRHLGFDPTGNGAVRSAVPENPTLEPNMKGIGWRVAELRPFEVFHVHSGRRTDTGHRISETADRMWFYILSNAAKQFIGQTTRTRIEEQENKRKNKKTSSDIGLKLLIQNSGVPGKLRHLVRRVSPTGDIGITTCRLLAHLLTKYCQMLSRAGPWPSAVASFLT